MKTKYDRIEDQLYWLKKDLEEAEVIRRAAENALQDAEYDVQELENQIDELEYLKQGNP
jgi:chromosome segregation ATPase